MRRFLVGPGATVSAALSLSLACGVTQMRGGHVVPRGEEPRGRVLLHYEPVGCVDRAGQRTASELGNVWLVRVEGGADVLVSTRPGYDSVVIDNEFVAGGERVFQLSIEGGPDRDVLLDYRLPVVGEGPGRVAVVRKWREVRGEQPAIRAHFVYPAVVCRLDPAPVEETPAREVAPRERLPGERSRQEPARGLERAPS